MAKDTKPQLMSLVKSLSLEELHSVLAQGFCHQCEALLENRIHSFLQEKVGNEKSTIIPEEKSSETWIATPIQKSSSLFRSVTTPPEVRSVSSGNDLSEKERSSQVKRKKDFVHIEKVNGKPTNVVQGLELHTGVFNAEEQKEIVRFVYDLQRKGQSGQLRERTYTEPAKWMRGKGRVTIQFGCCYNYAEDMKGNPPGILRAEEVDPLPPRLKDMIKRLVNWRILPSACVPNSCIVNIYDEGDCIPPHIDHHDFLRPFCTVSFLTESNILFGSSLKILGPGEFSGPVSIPLPLGSVLVLNGNGADIAKHCVPGVPGKRISITFRKMDESKLPYNYRPDPDLVFNTPVKTPFLPRQLQPNLNNNSSPWSHSGSVRGGSSSGKPTFEKDDFPALGSFSSSNQKRATRTATMN